MTHTRTTGEPATSTTTLRGETVSTVAVLADSASFTAMTAYRSFGFTSHDGYLRHLKRHLARLARRGGHVRVALFEPGYFAEHCVQRELDPDSVSARASYAARSAALGATVPYAGQPVRQLLGELLAAHERRRSYELCAEVLADRGPCEGCAGAAAGCLLRQAAKTVAEVVRRAGPGGHRLVCSLLTPGGLAMASVAYPSGPGSADADDDALLKLVLAAALAQGTGGGLVLRTALDAPPSAPGGEAVTGPSAPDMRISGWALAGGRLRPLTEAEVFAACCTQPGTGEPLPPEAGVAHRAATELPDYRCGPPGDR